ncbi:hypothetical protein Sm713_52660 [Streptomyces sp. TS71-3]|nr:hypothetical protein Sm713_52660 [Streptomyces sp. TS71-3]
MVESRAGWLPKAVGTPVAEGRPDPGRRRPSGPRSRTAVTTQLPKAIMSFSCDLSLPVSRVVEM